MAQSARAFPTAEGFGANAVGGRGGRIVEVTNLDDSGPGSLRSCLEASGPRICVFRVSGTITLKSAIQVRTPYLTIAGQTSPGGVQIKGTGQPDGDWGVWFVNGAHDIVVRHLRVRMGGNMKHDAGNNILFYGTAEPGVHDMIVDHCSVSWGSDTQLDWYGSNHEGSTHLVNQAQYDAGKPFPVPPVAMDAVSDLLDKVLAGAGAYKPSRDAIDSRIVKSVRDRTGTSRASTTGPWPDLAAGAPVPPTDSDHDGMPDAWEIAHGLDPHNASDGAALATSGYTNVENYLNELAGDPIGKSGTRSTEPPVQP